MTTETPSASCPVAHGGRFNYCFWAKLLVAIPALPLLAFWAASFVKDETAQYAVAAAAILAALLLARWLDRLPALARKIRTAPADH